MIDVHAEDNPSPVQTALADSLKAHGYAEKDLSGEGQWEVWEVIAPAFKEMVCKRLKEDGRPPQHHPEWWDILT